MEERLKKCVTERGNKMKKKLDQLCAGLEHINGLKRGLKNLLEDFIAEVNEDIHSVHSENESSSQSNVPNDSKIRSVAVKKETMAVKSSSLSSPVAFRVKKEGNNNVDSNNNNENGKEETSKSPNVKEESNGSQNVTPTNNGRKRKNLDATSPVSPFKFLAMQGVGEKNGKVIPCEPRVDPSFTAWEVDDYMKDPERYSVIALDSNDELKSKKKREIFLSCLSKNKNRIEVVYLSQNDFTDKDVKEIISSLIGSKSLTYVGLSQNEMEECSPEIGELLRTSPMKQLYINRNDISSVGLSKWVDSIGNLMLLDLGHNELGIKGAKILADHLKSNTCLQELYVPSNRFGPQGAIYFAEMLRVNQTLSILYMGGDDIQSTGANVVAEAMKYNKGITKLALDSNHIDDSSLESFGQMMKINKSLRILLLDSNDLTVEGVKKSLIPILIGSNITSLDIWRGKILVEAANQKKEIKNICRTNSERLKKSKE